MMPSQYGTGRHLKYPGRADMLCPTTSADLGHQLTHAAQQKHLFVTLSGIASNLSGICKPSDFAALRLMTNSNLVG
jgi:hypothetical protein